MPGESMGEVACLLIGVTIGSIKGEVVIADGGSGCECAGLYLAAARGPGLGLFWGTGDATVAATMLGATALT